MQTENPIFIRGPILRARAGNPLTGTYIYINYIVYNILFQPRKKIEFILHNTLKCNSIGKKLQPIRLGSDQLD